MGRGCVFLDRDGVINVKAAAGHYVNSWQEFRWIPGIADWIRLFNALDYLVIVVTNQRGVARGVTDESELAEIHRKMQSELASRGAHIHDIYVCPHAAGTCDCRKPQPGLVLAARRKWDIDLSRSLFIGDSDCDAELAARCGIRFVRVEGGQICDVVDPSPLSNLDP